MALDAERIVTNVLKVAALPAIALKFSEAIKNPLTSNQDLENIVSEDSALAAKVLMIANSALRFRNVVSSAPVTGRFESGNDRRITYRT